MKLNKTFELSVISQFDTKSIKEEGDTLTIRGYANTVSVDRAKDVILSSAWRTKNALTNYLKNPIILAYHDHAKPIGKMSGYDISEKGLEIEAEISKGAGDVYQLIKDGILKTFSVGFRCLDADYDDNSEVFVIKDLELLEVSVVSVPCNQDSVFEVSKSFKDAEDYIQFKKQVLSNNSSGKLRKEEQNTNLANTLELDEEEKGIMPDTNKTLEALMAKLNKLEEAGKEEKALRELEAREKAEKERKQKEEARIKALVDNATGDQKKQLESAVAIIADLEKRLGDNDVSSFAKTIESIQGQIKSAENEIAQVLAARDGKDTVAASVSKAFNLGTKRDWEAEAEKAVLLTKLLNKESIGDTHFGSELQKAVNTSSSIEVSDEDYETVFSSRILRDVQKLLVVGAMFQELPMSSKKLTMQIEPEAGTATWVNASSYGTDATTGGEVTAALTNISFETFLLSAKAYMTDETEEDAITALLPIIRRHLVESHAKAIEMAFMGGEDTAPTGKPTGLLTFANLDRNRVATTATHDGATKVSAKMIHALRRKLGLKGLRLADLALIVSMDAYYDLLEDDEWQDVNQVGANDSIKLQGQVGRIYGMPVVVSSYFPAKATKKEFCTIVYRPEFVMPRQRAVTVEYDREASKRRDAYYVSQRVNLQRYFTGNVVAGTYA